MKQFLKELLCSHDYSEYKEFLTFGGIRCVYPKCRKCGKVSR